MKFEWDSNKNKLNQRKHRISFGEAASAFFDQFGIVIHDNDHSNDEDRFVLLGMSTTLNLLVVCFCERQSGDVIRIISARRANKKEKQVYQERGDL